MCHEWWMRRRWEEREESRRLWEEFEQTRPLSDPKAPEQAPEVTLEQPDRGHQPRDPAPLSTDR